MVQSLRLPEEQITDDPASVTKGNVFGLPHYRFDLLVGHSCFAQDLPVVFA